MNRQRLALVFAGCAIAIGMTACEAEKKESEEEMAMRLQEEYEEVDDVSTRAIFDNLTPELMTLTDRPIDVDRKIAVDSNTNWRLFWEDWGRALLLERPSRLTPKPVPY